MIRLIRESNWIKEEPLESTFGGWMKRVYLDYPSSTPMAGRVASRVWEAMVEGGGNPSNRTHSWGRKAYDRVARAGQQVSSFLGCAAEELVWTSGATEANNAVIWGVMSAGASRRGLVTCATEHRSVLAPCRRLAAEGVVELRELSVDGGGVVRQESLESGIDEQVRLVSVMAGNNETGVLQPIEEIGGRARDAGAMLHCDATQVAGKRALDVKALGVDFLSFSGHKMYGPPGVGALYMGREHVAFGRVKALMAGDSPLQPLRPGTLNVPGIVGLGEACAMAMEEGAEESQRLEALARELRGFLAGALEGCHFWSPESGGVPGLVSVAFEGVEAAALVGRLEALALSTGAACHGDVQEPSHVLQAMQVPEALYFSTLRIGLGRPTTAQELEFAAHEIVREVRFLRSLGV